MLHGIGDLLNWARRYSLALFVEPGRLGAVLGSDAGVLLAWLGDRFPSADYRSTRTIDAVLGCGVQWEETDLTKLARIRRSLLSLSDDHLKRIVARPERPEICTPETYHELLRTPRMQERLRAVGHVKKPVTEREKRKIERERLAEEAARLIRQYDRGPLYDQVWSHPVQEVAKRYGISGVRLGKVCRTVNIPVPPRGYWARVRSGQTVRRPHLPPLK
jgi:hypothetical protein